jgi:hypothetical protein
MVIIGLAVRESRWHNMCSKGIIDAKTYITSELVAKIFASNLLGDSLVVESTTFVTMPQRWNFHVHIRELDT